MTKRELALKLCQTCGTKRAQATSIRGPRLIHRCCQCWVEMYRRLHG